MSDDYLTEQEQIQQLKNWVKQYGLTIIIGIVISIILSSGWHYYQNYKNRILLHASAVYDEMLTLRNNNKMDDALVQAKKLLSNYSKTPYAQMAAFIIARDAVLKKNYPDAITQLDWVITHSKTDSIKEIARIRIARIQIADKKPQLALETLKNFSDKNFIGFVDEVRGDAYLALNDQVNAKQAYALALKEIPNAETVRPILEMKYDNLAGIQDTKKPITTL